MTMSSAKDGGLLHLFFYMWCKREEKGLGHEFLVDHRLPKLSTPTRPFCLLAKHGSVFQVLTRAKQFARFPQQNQKPLSGFRFCARERT